MTGFSYPAQRSKFTTILRSSDARFERVHTSAGYNSNAVKRHLIGLHLGAPVPILHQRNGQEKIHHFRPGDVIFTPAGPDVHYAHPAEVDAFYIELDPQMVLQTATEIGLSEDQVNLRDNLGTSDPTIHQIGHALLRELEAPGLGGRIYVETLTTQLAIHLLRRYSEAQPAHDAQAEPNAARLRPVIEYIHDHLADDLSLAELARIVHLTPYYFSRLFKQTYGVAPHQYVIQQRVEAARRLLENPRLTVAEVALMVGFVDHSHLIRHYKRLFGRPPRT